MGFAGRYLFLNGDNISQFGGVNPPMNITVTAEPISALQIFSGILNISLFFGVIFIILVGYIIFKSKGESKY